MKRDLLACIVSFGFLVACGSSDTTNTDEDTSTVKTTTATEANASTRTENKEDDATATVDSATTTSTETNTKTSAETATETNTKTGTETIKLKIAAFNADILGKTKMGKANIAGYIAEIVTRYDVILIQEIRDISEETPKDLLSLVNAKNKGTYALSLSERLGRTSSKEQYAFYYKQDGELKVDKEEVYSDASDVFEREPYLVKFSKGTASFTLIGVHIKPDDAVNEINHLDEVYADAAAIFSADESIILGDLNADCSYVSNTNYQNLDLIKQGFSFKIAKDLDTTVSTTDCAYDNIVTKSSNLSGVAIYDFKSVLGLDSTTAEAVSNHFPVEFDLTLKN